MIRRKKTKQTGRRRRTGPVPPPEREVTFEVAARSAQEVVAAATAQQRLLSELIPTAQTHPATLERLYGLDQYASHTLRRARGLQVLAGQHAERQGPAVPLAEIVRAAAGMVAVFERLVFGDIAPLTVRPALADDLALLVAELMDNALNASTTAVQVATQHTDSGWLNLSVWNAGLTVSAQWIARANESLAGPVAPLGRWGNRRGIAIAHRIISHHDLQMTFSSTEGVSGQPELTAATVHLPAALLGTHLTHHGAHASRDGAHAHQHQAASAHAGPGGALNNTAAFDLLAAAAQLENLQ